jgi:hypothetical protein
VVKKIVRSKQRDREVRQVIIHNVDKFSTKVKALSRVWVTVDRIWILNWMYWKLTGVEKQFNRFNNQTKPRVHWLIRGNVILVSTQSLLNGHSRSSFLTQIIYKYLFSSHILHSYPISSFLILNM